jgi:hypothetical protein
MNPNCRRDGSRVIQQMLMFLTAFAVVLFARELEQFHLSKIICFFVAVGISGLIAFPAFRATRYVAQKLVGLSRKP